VAVLPDWEPGTPGVLCVAGLHSIPVSTALRAGDARVLFALGSKRETLALLHRDPRASLCLLGAGVAFTAYGLVALFAEELAAAPVAALELRVESVADHLADGRTEMLDGARWRRPDREIEKSDAAIAKELENLAAG
jgi:hypothetical protein